MEITSCHAYPNGKLLQLITELREGDFIKVVMLTRTVSFYNENKTTPTLGTVSFYNLRLSPRGGSL